MRIVGGKHRGRQLKRVMKDSTRETADMVKVAVFNMLMHQTEGTVLDLFAGSGAYGIEAISRGAKDVYFVDIDKDACKTIKDNLLMIDEMDHAKVYQMTHEQFLKSIDTDLGFDVVFLDPPYRLNIYEDVINVLSTRMHEDGVIVCESAKQIDLPDELFGLSKIKEKTYGIKKITIFQK